MEPVYVNAGNDSNGNPRRGWVIVDHGRHIAFVDEGYDGRRALNLTGYANLREAADNSPEMAITPGQYRKYCKL